MVRILMGMAYMLLSVIGFIQYFDFNPDEFRQVTWGTVPGCNSPNTPCKKGAPGVWSGSGIMTKGKS